jgi:hypothetical protein
MSSAPQRRLKIAFLADTHWLFINTVQEYIESFDLYSRHDVEIFSTQPLWRYGTISRLEPVSFEGFDVVLIHYSARPCTGTMVPEIEEALHTFSGFKSMMLQDEYEFTARSRRWMVDHKINHVFTVVPGPYVEKVYPPEMLPGITFTSILTGYVPLALERIHHVRPIEDRKVLIAYRGRALAFQYGDLAQEKLNIGKHVRSVCEQQGLPVDIEWTEDKRIYGRNWNDFLQSARATLGTESGANVFDMDGTIAERMNAVLQKSPDLTYEEVRGRLFKEENIGVKMNQISPKFFEFIAARTALILFEGEYSGVLVPHRHYFPLKKDYSNLEEILSKLDDIPLLKQMTTAAYEDVVASGRYSYRAFVSMIDEIFEQHIRPETAMPDGTQLSTAPPLTRQMARLRQLRNSGIVKVMAHQISELEAKKQNFAEMIERRRAKMEKLQTRLEQKRESAGNTA